MNKKQINLARYLRRYARHVPVVITGRWKYEILNFPPRERQQLAIPGFVQYMRQLVRMQFGEKGKWGHGKFQNATKSGPGRRPIARIARIKAAGTKLSRSISFNHEKFHQRLHDRLNVARARALAAERL